MTRGRVGLISDLSITFKYDWVTVKSDLGEPYGYPQSIGLYLGRKEPLPGIYRWKIDHLSSPSSQSVLIGESENLLRRLGEYVSPTTKEEAAWKARFTQELASGSRITLELLNLERASVGNAVFDKGDLGDPFLRKLIENALVLTQKEDGRCTVLNKARHLRDKVSANLEREIARLEAKLTEIKGRHPN